MPGLTRCALCWAIRGAEARLGAQDGHRSSSSSSGSLLWDEDTDLPITQPSGVDAVSEDRRSRLESTPQLQNVIGGPAGQGQFMNFANPSPVQADTGGFHFKPRRTVGGTLQATSSPAVNGIVAAPSTTNQGVSSIATTNVAAAATQQPAPGPVSGFNFAADVSTTNNASNQSLGSVLTMPLATQESSANPNPLGPPVANPAAPARPIDSFRAPTLNANTSRTIQQNQVPTALNGDQSSPNTSKDDWPDDEGFTNPHAWMIGNIPMQVARLQKVARSAGHTLTAGMRKEDKKYKELRVQEKQEQCGQFWQKNCLKAQLGGESVSAHQPFGAFVSVMDLMMIFGFLHLLFHPNPKTTRQAFGIFKMACSYFLALWTIGIINGTMATLIWQFIVLLVPGATEENLLAGLDGDVETSVQGSSGASGKAFMIFLLALVSQQGVTVICLALVVQFGCRWCAGAWDLGNERRREKLVALLSLGIGSLSYAMKCFTMQFTNSLVKAGLKAELALLLLFPVAFAVPKVFFFIVRACDPKGKKVNLESLATGKDVSNDEDEPDLMDEVEVPAILCTIIL